MNHISACWFRPLAEVTLYSEAGGWHADERKTSSIKTLDYI